MKPTSSISTAKSNFVATKELSEKITITITSKALWENYVSSWKDIMYDASSPEFFTHLKEIADVLLVKDLVYLSVRKLFKDGHTVMLLGDGMSYFDRPNVLREIVVVNGTSPLRIRHEDICF